MSLIKQKNLRGVTLTNYVEWLRLPERQHTVGVGNGKNRAAPKKLYIHPFNITMPTTLMALTSASSTSYEALESKVVGYAIATLPVDGTVFARKPRQYSPARVVQTIERRSKGTSKTSHITKNPYLSYGGTSRSVPFGQTGRDAGEDEVDIFAVIRGRFMAGGVIPTGQTVTLVKEKFTAKS